MRRLLLILVALAVTVTADYAAAQLISPVSQTRTVAGNANGNDNSGSDTDSGSDAAPGFAPFSSGAAGNITLVDVAASGSGNQNSSILSDRLEATGGCGGFAETYGYDQEDADAGGSSVFDVTFTLTGEADYSLIGSIGAFDNGSVTLVFSGPGGTIFSSDGCCDGFVPLNEAGTLPAGQYRLEITSGFSAYAYGGSSDYGSGEYDVDLVFTATVTGVPDVPPSPHAFRSGPNPLSRSAEIRFFLPESAETDLAVFSVAGRRVATLVSRRLGPGEHRLVWDGVDGGGARLKSGVYFYRFRAGGRVETHKLVLVR